MDQALDVDNSHCQLFSADRPGNSKGLDALVDPVQPVGNLLQVTECQLKLYIFFIYSGFLP